MAFYILKFPFCPFTFAHICSTSTNKCLWTAHLLRKTMHSLFQTWTWILKQTKCWKSQRMLESKRQNTERKHNVIDLTPVLKNFQFTKIRLLLQSLKIWYTFLERTTTTHFPDLYRSSFNTPPTFFPQITKRVTEFSPGSSLSEPLQLSAASLIVSGHCADLTNAAWLLLQFFFFF